MSSGQRTEHEVLLIRTLRRICATAAPCSAEAEEANIADPHGARCAWLIKYREAQRLACAALREVGAAE